MHFWRSWKYKNLTFLFISLVFAFFLGRYEPFHEFLLSLDGIGYLGAFIAGMLFVSTFGFAAGAVTILVLAEELNILELGIIAGLGGVFGDFMLFRFVKDRLIDEVEPIYKSLGGNHLNKILHTKHFRWMFPVVGAAIIASPLPDELGVSLMGISKIKTWKFLILAFCLDFTSVVLILLASGFIKP